LEEKEEKVIRMYKIADLETCSLCGEDLDDAYAAEIMKGRAELVCEKCVKCLRNLAELGFLKVKVEE
jgi:hypothetical protein